MPMGALAGTTGAIQGTVTDTTSGAPIAGVIVSASALSQTAKTTTDARGFYALNGLTPDTYTVSFQAQGYESTSQPGVTAAQDQNVTVNVALAKQLKVIASVQSSGGSNLLKPTQGSDVYQVTGAEANAVTGADHQPQTLYTYLATVPGVTISGGIGAPRIRGGDTHDIGYEFDGIPIRERMFGLFTSNITSVGIGNVEVYTGGIPANDAGSGAGIINSVVKSGTYPASGTISYGVTTPDFNNYPSLEYGGMTQNRRYSYYLAYGSTYSQNVYNYGRNTYPNFLFADISGPVTEHDLVGNFHYRPDAKNDFQFLYQNGLGDFNFNYLLNNPGQGGPLPVGLAPCPGHTSMPNSYFGVTGGTAPNGQACPAGFYFSAVPGAANLWHHYSTLGKIQWNHTINDHSFLAFDLAENYNQYIFDQPYADPNLPGLENPGGYLNISPLCPSYPYQAGSPVQIYPNTPGGVPDPNNACTYDIQSFYGDRRSNMYFGRLDYTNEISPNLTIKIGGGQEYDKNLFAYYLKDSFSGDGTFPNAYAYSDVPTHVPFAYASAEIQRGKLHLSPGLYYSRIYYGAPTTLGGSQSTSILNPTFNGAFAMSPKDAVRFSYGNSSSFVGSAYIFREFPHAAGGAAPNPSYNPSDTVHDPGATIAPELVQSADLMWEHNFDSSTSMRVGPWYNNALGYYESFRPVKGFSPSGAPIYGPSSKSNSGHHHALGIEFALNHVSHANRGFSYYLDATYDNYWTSGLTSLLSASPLVTPLPSYFTSKNIFTRSGSNPLFTATLTGDYHSGRFDWYPQVFYNLDTFYNIGYAQPKTGPPHLLPTYLAGGWYFVNMSFTETLGNDRSVVVGLRAKNFLDQENGPTPCLVSDSTGCGLVNGPNSGLHGLTPGSYIDQPVANFFTAYPRSFEFFLIKKL